MKITGAHDFNDYQVAKRGNIPMYRLMDWKAALRSDGAPYAEEAAKAKALREAEGTPDATYVDGINLVPDDYRGLDRFEARKKIVADIDADGLMITVEDKKIQQPFGDRSGVVIEPMITDQWFADAKKLAEPAIKAVKDGKTRFVPENWEKTYFQWMNNIEPWCVSRQLWWGHRIPAWYGPTLEDIKNDGPWNDKVIFVAETEEAMKIKAREYYGSSTDIEIEDGPWTSNYETDTGETGVGVYRDDDVLDTWFSSGLWPFSTLGWPDASPPPRAGRWRRSRRRG